MTPRRPSRPRDLSSRQTQVLDYVRASFFARGIAPTYREIAKRLGIHSHGSAAKYVQELVRKGYLEKPSRYQSRGVRPIGVNPSYLVTQVTIVAPDGKQERLWLVGRTTIVTKDGTKVRIATPGFHQGPRLVGRGGTEGRRP